MARDPLDPVLGIIELHDATPAKLGEPHGPAGPTHCANATVDYEYQLEQLLIDLVDDNPEVVMVRAPDGRTWDRHGREWVARESKSRVPPTASPAGGLP